MVKARCDDCREVFEPKLKGRSVGRSIEITYFKCPRCHVETYCYATDNKTRRMLKENNSLREKSPLNKVDKERFDSNQQQIESRMDELKLKYGRS